MNSKYQAPLLPGEFYHLFNRANTQGEQLFPQERNYRYFLQKWTEYVGGRMDVLAYCLMPNHFHFLVRVNDDARDNTAPSGVIPSPSETERDNIPSRDVIPNDPSVIPPSEALRRLFITYTQAINKQEQRRGSLFQEHPKRLRIESDSHLLSLIRYIHNNPVHHGLVAHLEDWRYSSYHALSNQAQTQLARQAVLDMFGGIAAFVAFHQQPADNSEIAYCIVEE